MEKFIEKHLSGKPENLYLLFTYIITAILFYPITRWIFIQTLKNQQLVYSFLILGFAGLTLIIENKKRLKFTFKSGKLLIRFLFSSYLLMICAIVFKVFLFLFISYILAIASLLIFIFGEEVYRPISILLIAFFLYLLFIVALPFFDWPLRGASGKNAAWLLELIGYSTHLTVSISKGEPLLTLTVNNRPFLVATECNGFGLLSSSILLTLLLVFYKNTKLRDKLLLLSTATVISILNNSLRITFIIMLAPLAGTQYHIMHEIIGFITFWSTLIFIWWMVQR